MTQIHLGTGLPPIDKSWYSFLNYLSFFNKYMHVYINNQIYILKIKATAGIWLNKWGFVN